MTSMHSRRRASRAFFGSHLSPVTCSFMASPLPKATQNRPGNMAPRVPMACAMITGW